MKVTLGSFRKFFCSAIFIISTLLFFNGAGWACHSLGDLVWEDLNRDGIQDIGEPGIAGVTVELHYCSDDSIVGTSTTDDTGTYIFDHNPPYIPTGDFYVKFVAPSGYIFTTQNAGSSDETDSDADADGITECTQLSDYEHDMTWDAGLIPEIIAPNEIGKVYGDPHFIGGDGGTFNYYGHDSGKYSLLSDQGLNFNGKFSYANDFNTKTVVSKTQTNIDNDDGTFDRIRFLANGTAKLNGEKLIDKDKIILPNGTRIKYIDLSNKKNPGNWLRLLTIKPRLTALALIRVRTPEGYLIEQVALQAKNNKHIDTAVQTPASGVANGMLPDGLLGQTFDDDIIPLTEDDFVGDYYEVERLNSHF